MTKPYVRLWAVGLLGLALAFTSIHGVRAGEEGSSGEIGIPVAPVAEKGRHVDAAFMAPDGKHFYTLYEGFLSKFSIKPFKRVSTWEIDFKEILSAENFFKLFITPDENKLIITNNEKHKVVLVDIGTGDIIKSVSVKQRYRMVDLPGGKYRNVEVRMNDAVLNGSELVVFKTNKIVIFDAYTLSKRREVPFGWKAGRFHTHTYKVFNKIVYKGRDGVGLVDIDTYNGKKLYGFFTDITEKSKCSKINYEGAKFTFDLNSLEDGMIKKFNICGYPEKNDDSFAKKRTIILRFGPISTAGNYVVQGYRYTLRDLNTSKKYEIAQYPDGEVILLEKSDPKHFVTLTPQARKHLKMKNAEGEIVPINDATFDKYRIAHP